MKYTKKDRLYQVYEYVLLLLMGALCFSTLTTKLSQDYLHLPLTLPELFFIPLYLLLRDRFKNLKLEKNTFAVLLILLLFLVLWGLIWGQFGVTSILSAARGFLYLFFFYTIFKNKKTKYDEETIILICFGSIIGWFITSRMNMRILIDTQDAAQDYGNMLSVALFMMFTIMQKRWRLFAIGFIMILAICIFSGIRRVILVTLLAFVIPVLLQILVNKKSIIRQLLLASIVIVPIVIAIPIVKGTVEDLSPVLYYRLFEKTEKTMAGESEVSDDFRKSMIKDFISSPSEYFIPRGMISTHTTRDKGVGTFMDVPITALSYMFSAPIALIIVLVFLFRSIKCVLFFKNRNDVSAGVYGAMGGILFVLLFVEGSFLMYPFITPFTGLCLGRFIYYSKQYDVMRNHRYSKLVIANN